MDDLASAQLHLSAPQYDVGMTVRDNQIADDWPKHCGTVVRLKTCGAGCQVRIWKPETAREWME